MKCLLGQKSIIELLGRVGIDPAELSRCLLGCCKNDKRQAIATRLAAVVSDSATATAILDALDEAARDPQISARGQFVELVE